MANAFATREEIGSSQLAQLRRLVSALVPTNRFYSQKFSPLGSCEIRSLEDFTTRFPFTTKQELVEDQLAQPPYGTNLTFPQDHYTRLHQTSGTRGQPLRWLDTPENWNWMVESWRTIFLAAGVKSDERVYFAFSFGPFIGFWLAFEAAQKLGCLCIPGGGLSSEARLRGILDNGASILCCTPTYALRLGEVAAQQGTNLAQSKIKTIIVAGEAGGSIPATRDAISKLWNGARVFDHHGMTETGPVTYECPAQPGILHVIESAYLAEIVEPTNGKPVQPGDVGELVLTTLGRIGSPLLRYRTGDLVKQKKQTACVCGCVDMALDGGILGRADDMVIVRGVNIYPSAVEEIIRSCGGIAEFRMHISHAHALPEIKVVIEPASDCSEPKQLSDKLGKMFSHAFALRVPVEIVNAGALPRFEMKAKRWVIES
ncbi:MAG: phenylacetate--CoA ligase family protein [Verrucomicrobiales bacterium]|nr:phenylacetate--CoA ligase family protein [Verrucomicrobiales bacterium]